MDKFKLEELLLLYEFLGSQNLSDTRNIIEKYELSLDEKVSDKVLSKLHDTIRQELLIRGAKYI